MTSGIPGVRTATDLSKSVPSSFRYPRAPESFSEKLSSKLKLSKAGSRVVRFTFLGRPFRRWADWT